jgi:hypothetical protein
MQNIRGSDLPEQIIGHYMDDTLFIVRAHETSVDNLVENFHNFGVAFGLEIN